MTSPKRSTWSCPWSETEKTPLGAHLWMHFSTVDRSCVKLFLFLTVLLKRIFLKMGFIVFRWRRGIKRRDNSLHIDWYKQGSLSLLKSYDFERLWWVKIAILVAWSKSCQRIDITAWIKLTQRSYCVFWKRINRFYSQFMSNQSCNDWLGLFYMNSCNWRLIRMNFSRKEK